MGLNAEAETSFAAAARLAPTSAKAFDGLATALHKQRKRPEAEAAHATALRLDPTASAARREQLTRLSPAADASAL